MAIEISTVKPAFKTTTKMLGAPVTFGRKANTCGKKSDLGMPGTLPEVNREALQACMALHLSIDPLVKFDRKTIIIPICRKDIRSRSSSSDRPRQ